MFLFEKRKTEKGKQKRMNLLNKLGFVCAMELDQDLVAEKGVFFIVVLNVGQKSFVHHLMEQDGVDRDKMIGIFIPGWLEMRHRCTAGCRATQTP